MMVKLIEGAYFGAINLIERAALITTVVQGKNDPEKKVSELGVQVMDHQ